MKPDTEMFFDELMQRIDSIEIVGLQYGAQASALLFYTLHAIGKKDGRVDISDDNYDHEIIDWYVNLLDSMPSATKWLSYVDGAQEVLDQMHQNKASTSSERIRLIAAATAFK